MNTDLYQGQDPRELPAYTLPRAAYLAGVPTPTLRSWVIGRSYSTQQGPARFSPILELPEDGSPYLSFVNVIEAHILGAIRRLHKVPLPNVRKAVLYVKEQFGTPHPLAQRKFETDGVDLFIRELDEVINASRGGQYAFKELIEARLTRIEHDNKGRALRLFPFINHSNHVTAQQLKEQPKVIVIDPTIAFGKPVLVGTGIPTAVIADRFKAGEPISSIAYDYNRATQEIEQALRYEQAAA